MKALAGDKFQKWIPYFTGIIAFAILWIFRSQQFSGDSLMYALDARRAAQMFHPHHLLYTPMVWLFWKVSSFFGDPDIITIAQFLNAAFAGGVVVLTVKLAKKIIHSEWLHLLVPLVMIASYGFFYFSTQMEVYLPAMFFSYLLIWLVLKGVDDPEIKTRRWMIPAMMAYVLAICFHQSAIFIGLIFPVAVIFRHGWKNILPSFFFLGGSGLLVLLLYTIGMQIELPKDNPAGFFESFYAFIFRYKFEGSGLGWGSADHFSWQGIKELLRGNGRTWFTEIHKNPSEPWNYTFAIILLWNLTLAFLDKSGINLLRIVLLSWIIPSYIFFLWWLPGELEFYIIFISASVLLLIFLGRDAFLLIKRLFPQNHEVKTVVPAAILLVPLLVLEMSNIGSFAKTSGEPAGGELTANAMYSIGDSNCVYMAPFYLEMHLRYFQDPPHLHSDRWIKQVFYETGDTPYIEHLSEWPILMDIQLVHPKKDIYGYTAAEHPSEHKRLMWYLFNIEGRMNDSISVRNSTFEDNNGYRFIKVDTERTTYVSFDAFLEEMDRKYAEKWDEEGVWTGWHQP